MAVLKCKMCGGDLNFEEGATVVECEYCGTKQTVPIIDDEKKITLFGRANRLRFACEFDKASNIYESIVADFPEEAEAYWELVLCKYGIEYVDDPATGKKIPTCHRSSFESVMEDDNFEQVLENADPIRRAVYREEAKQIEELRRGIIEVSNKEEPYDIFICYKETAENGERTIDSVIAQDVYNELTEKGYLVFFSRITLEDKLGQEYEPYIFAVLNSAKIMLAFGTDYEYYNAVWVKNEWSRFLQLIARGEKKTLIPCYKNIDAYDMPKEFAKLQAQDMGKVGAMQDLLRGIEKLLPKNEDTQTAQAAPGKDTVVMQQLMIDFWLKGVFTYLEDGKWDNAVEDCNRVLEISPENAEAHVGLLMAELQVHSEDELSKSTKRFEQNEHYIKAIRFAGEKRRKVLEGYRLKRAFVYLEDGKWDNAVEDCNYMLEIFPENAEVYVGLLMAELQIHREEDLARPTKRFEQNEYFIKAVRFAGEERRKVLEGYSKAAEDYLPDFWLKEAFAYLENGIWDSAVECCNSILEISPENVEAYVGLLMAELKVCREYMLARPTKSFEQNVYFLKAVQFAGEERRKVLEGYSKAAEEYQEKMRQKEQEQQRQRAQQLQMLQILKLNLLRLKDAKKENELQLDDLIKSRQQWEEKLKTLTGRFDVFRKQECTEKIQDLDGQIFLEKSKLEEGDKNIEKTELEIRRIEGVYLNKDKEEE